MKEFELNYRQIHLDFHTSPDIMGIGENFDPDEFAAELEKASVNSITCFARCHHGMIYYNSSVNPERVHPHLAVKDLLIEQVRACHKRGIKVPVYTTVQWDHFTAKAHPEWLSLDAGGGITDASSRKGPFEPGFYNVLCVNTPYREFLKSHVKEIIDLLGDELDGLFFDIVSPIECSCHKCIEGMKSQGLEPHIKENRQAYAHVMIDGFKKDMTDFIREHNKTCTIFYNRGHIGPEHRNSIDAFTHFELESLPSGAWGYLHFPVTMKYARNLGIDCLGMTGKFHTAWGDFHSFKNEAALEFECFNMLACGAKCSVGDQLEPNGKLSPEVYELIGSVYSKVKAKEAWCENAEQVVEAAVFSPEEYTLIAGKNMSDAIQGAARMLQEASIQFDIIDSKMDFSKYKVLILPDEIPVSEELNEKLGHYIKNGGHIIASFESGLNRDKTGFAFTDMGVKLNKDMTRDIKGEPVRGRYFPAGDYAEYILPEGDIGKGLKRTEHVMYMKGTEVTIDKGVQILAHTVSSCFDRTYMHFCSHRQSPSSRIKSGPAVTRNGNIIYFSHPVFTQYCRNAPVWCKKLVINAIDMLIGERLLRHSGPTTLISAITRQTHKNRYVLHLMHYIPERRSRDMDIIEDIIPLNDVCIELRIPGNVKSVRTVPEGKDISFEHSDGRLSFRIPVIYGHCMAEIAY